MAYEVWEGESGNRIGVYRTERAALVDVDVADTVRRYGADSREALSLGLLGPHGHIADGAALIDRAETLKPSAA